MSLHQSKCIRRNKLTLLCVYAGDYPVSVVKMRRIFRHHILSHVGAPPVSISRLAASSLQRSVSVPAALVQTHLSIPMDAWQEYVSPSHYDLLLTDVKKTQLADIAKELGILMNGACPEGWCFPVHGTIFGMYHRVFVGLPVHLRGNTVHALFLLDTCAPCTYLTEDTTEALGLCDAIPSSFKVQVAGIPLTVAPSSHHFKDVNIIGQDFLKAARCLLQINYATDDVEIALAPPPYRLPASSPAFNPT
jgi:hypothetical protein